MATHDYKLTIEYVGALNWEVCIFQREVLVDRGRSDWRCLLSYKTPTLEGHVLSEDRLRQVLRSLGT